MVVTLDQLRPYDHDPRMKRNPAYEGNQGVHPRARPGRGASHHLPARRGPLHHPATAATRGWRSCANSGRRPTNASSAYRACFGHGRSAVKSSR